MDPNKQDIYIFQNQFGLVKIGRSIDVEKRRKAVERTDKCSVALVAILPGAGRSEERLHDLLVDFRVTGEWFDGSRGMKEVLEKATKKKIPLWPYEFDRVPASDWLKQLEILRDEEARSRQFYRMIQILSSSSAPNIYSDWQIWNFLYPNSRRQLVLFYFDGEQKIFHDNNGNKRIAINPLKKNGNITANKFVPRYTAEVSDAILAWPKQLRPVIWEGTAIDCAIQGLKHQWAKRKTEPVVHSGKPRFGGPKKNIPANARNRILFSED